MREGRRSTAQQPGVQPPRRHLTQSPRGRGLEARARAGRGRGGGRRGGEEERGWRNEALVGRHSAQWAGRRSPPSTLPSSLARFLSLSLAPSPVASRRPGAGWRPLARPRRRAPPSPPPPPPPLSASSSFPPSLRLGWPCPRAPLFARAALGHGGGAERRAAALAACQLELRHQPRRPHLLHQVSRGRGSGGGRPRRGRSRRVGLPSLIVSLSVSLSPPWQRGSEEHDLAAPADGRGGDHRAPAQPR